MEEKLHSGIREARTYMESGDYSNALSMYLAIYSNRENDRFFSGFSGIPIRDVEKRNVERKVLSGEVIPLISLLEERKEYAEEVDRLVGRLTEALAERGGTFGCGSEYGAAVIQYEGVNGRLETARQALSAFDENLSGVFEKMKCILYDVRA